VRFRDPELAFLSVLVDADEVTPEIVDRMQARCDETLGWLETIRTDPDESIEERLWAAEHAGRLASLMDAIRKLVTE
jgi:hypothetical protein